jgi:hypothetical protein
MSAQHPATWIRHGDTTDGVNQYRALSTAPTTVAHGIPCPSDKRAELAMLDIAAEAAGAFTFTIVVWGYKPAVGIYDSPGAAATAIVGANGPGWTNIGTIAVTGTGPAQAREVHQLQGITGFTRLAAQVTLATGSPNVWTDFGFAAHREE